MRQTLIIFFTDGGQPVFLWPGGFRGPGGLSKGKSDEKILANKVSLNEVSVGEEGYK
jgi:hypothetical protein